MTIELPSGFRILMDPVLPWESRRADLRIHSVGAFGPRHVTTRLCLQLMDRHRDRIDKVAVLDMGCGSGILTLAAARMGAASCTGVDICRRAITAAQRNAAINGLQSRVRWVLGSVGSLRGTFGCVVANLPFPTLCELLGELLGAVAGEGMLIISGFHDIQWHAVATRLGANGWVVSDVLSGELSFAAEPPSGSYTWMALVAQRNFTRPQASRAAGSMDNPP